MLTNKEASTRQENMIANYLGWHIVPGSGSRHGYPGDIFNDEWLGECKTHINETKNVKFYWEHWHKISNEALSRFKTPILFCDNGSQRSSSTLCLLKPIFNDLVKINDISGLSFNKSSLSVDLDDTLKKLSAPDTMITFKRNNIEYGITTLSNFKSFIGRY
nr:MAG TPA: hypothetical protein [Caudoviricetes sp.]